MAHPQVLNATEDDIHKMLAADVHLGTSNSDFMMAEYIWRRRRDGVHIINIGKTWEKLMLAARIITAIENPKDVIAICSRPYGQRAVLKFAEHTGASAIAGRFTPGTFTNQITKQFKEPRLLVVTDPRTDAQAVREASYVNLPVIAFCDSDSPLQFVDVAIPANNKGKFSIGLCYWFLSREVLRMRGTISRDAEWSVCPDLFFYREPEELEKAEEAAGLDDVAWNAAPVEPAVDEFPVAPAPDTIFDGATSTPVVPGGWDQPANTEPVSGWDSNPAASAPAAGGWDQEPSNAGGW